MVSFISRMIMRAGDTSLEAGRAKYIAYFLTGSRRYECFREDVEQILIEEGYGDLIVIE